MWHQILNQRHNPLISDASNVASTVATSVTILISDAASPFSFLTLITRRRGINYRNQRSSRHSYNDDVAPTEAISITILISDAGIPTTWSQLRQLASPSPSPTTWRQLRQLVSPSSSSILVPRRRDVASTETIGVSVTIPIPDDVASTEAISVTILMFNAGEVATTIAICVTHNLSPTLACRQLSQSTSLPSRRGGVNCGNQGHRADLRRWYPGDVHHHLRLRRWHPDDVASTEGISITILISDAGTVMSTEAISVTILIFDAGDVPLTVTDNVTFLISDADPTELQGQQRRDILFKAASRRSGASVGQRGWRANPAGPARECRPHDRVDE
ncbi:hypothetical protein E2C01_038365 [Portunus trituberculatus]|uniref:Uncharacterized protein n=1 Tax=Portunus trituberculatus TaxID=210409 RepID=A0A5B7FH18_PORTR|nr:hypothetical protein [Portunus trituberculatus]